MIFTGELFCSGPDKIQKRNNRQKSDNKEFIEYYFEYKPCTGSDNKVNYYAYYV